MPQHLFDFACLVPQEAFTRVLKGNIEISRTIFPSGTRGERLTFIHVIKNLFCIQNHITFHNYFVIQHHYLALFALICAGGCLINIFLCRCKHGDVRSPGFVGGGPELWPWHRARCWKLLRGS